MKGKVNENKAKFHVDPNGFRMFSRSISTFRPQSSHHHHHNAPFTSSMLPYGQPSMFRIRLNTRKVEYSGYSSLILFDLFARVLQGTVAIFSPPLVSFRLSPPRLVGEFLEWGQLLDWGKWESWY